MPIFLFERGMMNITMGITSSIAVEKSVDLIKSLKSKGHKITVSLLKMSEYMME